MAPSRLHSPDSALWRLAVEQHGVVTRAQLLALGLTPDGVRHWAGAGRLHPQGRGIYAVGMPRLSRHGELMGAVLGCGPGAVLSHRSAGALWGIVAATAGPIEISVPPALQRNRPGIIAHRRRLAPAELTTLHHMPVTTPALTLVDMATSLGRDRLEAAVNAADKLGLIDPEALRGALDRFVGRRGVAVLRATLDRRTFALTDSELERRFLPLARRAGLALPRTGRQLNGFKVDFFWPDLGLVVETDGLRYHRTPAQQARDRRRDQAHAAAGMTTLRFTHAQVAFERGHVEATLRAVARRLEGTE